MSNKTTTYHDFYFRIILALIGAHLIVMYNDPHSFFEVVFRWPYLRAMLGSFVIAFLLVQYIHYVTLRLDSRFDWHDQTLQRLFWQTVIGFLSPALFAFMLAAFFFWIFDMNILKTTYLSQDYTLIIFMLLAVNIYYFGLHSFLRYKEVAGNKVILPEADYPYPVPSPERWESLNEVQSKKQILIVDTATKSIPVRTEQIAYLYILSGTVFLRTFEMDSVNESYQINENLKAIEDSLDKKQFFRINRQMIVSFNAVKFYSPGKNKTLDIIVEPQPYPGTVSIPSEHIRLCVVSEDRATAFKDWMKR